MFADRARGVTPTCRLLLLYTLIYAMFSPIIAIFLLVVARRSDIAVSLTFIVLRNSVF
jgi:hypothetical protein